jgi:hypothetical protein
MAYDGGELVKRYERMKSYRGTFETVWHEIAVRVLPRADEFMTKRYPGQRREEFVFDSTAQLALPAFAAAMESMLTPRTQKWHRLSPPLELREHEPTVRWCENVRDLLFSVRYAPRANFASQAYEVYMGLGAFGTAGMFIEDGLSDGIRYQNIPLSELYVQEDGQGVVDTVFRKYSLTARQAVMRFGPDCPADVSKWVAKEPDREFEFMQAVMPDTDYTRKRGRKMRWKACDVFVEKQNIVREGGYRTFPYAVSRYTTAPREVYGRSPAWDALADIKSLNEMAKTSLRYGQLVTDPPWLTADVDSLSPFAVRPGAINAGYMNEQGMALAKSLTPDGDPRLTLEMADQRRQAINRAFLVTLFQILVDTPQMTATEAMLRAQEKGALLAPTVGRQQSEFLGPLIARELDILMAAGALPPMPPELVEAGGFVGIEYESPLVRQQRSEEAVGILRTYEVMGTVAAVDPSVMQVFDHAEAARILAEVNGAPMRIVKSRDQVAAEQQAAQQAAATQQLIEAAPALGNTVKSLAQAQQAAGQAAF